MKAKPNLSPLEHGLLTALQAIENQIARQMQKNTHKWEPIEQRVELLTTFLLDNLGEDKISLESIMVLAQASTKTLSIVSSDLAEEGLGKVRTAYVNDTFSKIERDCRQGLISNHSDIKPS